MSQDNFHETELQDGNPVLDRDDQRFLKKDNDQPKQSPIRRKSKMRQEERVKSKVIRIQKKDEQRFKHKWQEN